MISNIVRNYRCLQRPLYAHFLNKTVCYQAFHSTQFKSSQHQVSPGNLWSWHKFWRTWAPVPTLFGITILIVWQYSRKLNHRFINDECSTASQLEIQCYRSIPLRFLSRSWGKLSHLHIPAPFRRFFYLVFSKTYGINLDEVKDDLDSYTSLGEFFIRQLKDGVRPISLEDLVSPADGTVLNCGQVTSCCVEQVKGTTYLIKSFLGENTWSKQHQGADYGTSNKSTNTPLAASYLSPAPAPQPGLPCQDYMSLLGGLEKEFKCAKEESSQSENVKHIYVKGKSKDSEYSLELPVVPNFLDYYVKEILQTVYSSISLLLYRGNLSMSVDYYALSSSAAPVSSSVTTPTAPICTPTAEQEWAEYKRRLLHNPQENELYQIIVYLAPGDYHRFHSPAHTHIKYRRHFQGDLLSVNPCVACWIPDLFVLNERAAYMGDWKHGFFSMVMVGATNVGSIKVHCDDTLLTNSKRWSKGVRHKDLPLSSPWEKGQEVGEFRMGSTVVLLFEAPKSFQFSVVGGDKVKVGQNLIRK